MDRCFANLIMPGSEADQADGRAWRLSALLRPVLRVDDIAQRLMRGKSGVLASKSNKGEAHQKEHLPMKDYIEGRQTALNRAAS